MHDPVEPAPTAVPQPPVPWNAGEIVFLFFFAFLAFFVLVWRSIGFELLQRTGFFAWYYAGVSEKVADREQLWALTFPFPLQVATLLGFAFLFLGARPAVLGLTRARLGRNLLLGLGGAALLTPVVLGVHQAIVWWYDHVLGIPKQVHPLALLGQMNLTRLEWSLWLFAAIIAAPVLEELLFRGIFQPAAGRSRWSGAVGIGLAALLAVVLRQEALGAALSAMRAKGWSALPAFLSALAPLLFVGALLPVILLVFRHARSHAGPAVLSTALLFAMVHVSVWPSPVALLVLALGLGWLKEWTGSLIGPIVLHGLFNAVSCVMVLLGTP